MAHFHRQLNYFWFLHPSQSLEPLPSSGHDFGALGEEAEFVEVEPEAKQEILENKDVSVLCIILMWFLEFSPGKPYGEVKELTCHQLQVESLDFRTVAPVLGRSWVTIDLAGLGKHVYFY